MLSFWLVSFEMLRFLSMTHSKPPPKMNSMRSIFLGGVIPIVVFTLVEEYFGTLWGLIAGMVFGLGEIIYEKVTQKKVTTITWIGNGLLLGMGGIAIFTSDGIWFKLQPAIIELFMAGLLMGSSYLGRPFLLLMAKKQNTFARVPEALRTVLEKQFRGLNFRIGIFFLAHAILATWAALHWSTRAWAILKGVGLTVSLVVYMVIEIFWLKFKMRKNRPLR